MEARKKLVEEPELKAVISLPSGVFKPYAGVATAILVFTRSGKTEHTWFYRLENDGLYLDDKRQRIPGSELPDVVAQWRARDPSVLGSACRRANLSAVAVAPPAERCVDLMVAKELPKDAPLSFAPGEARHRLRTVIARRLRMRKMFAPFKADTELSNN